MWLLLNVVCVCVSVRQCDYQGKEKTEMENKTVLNTAWSCDDGFKDQAAHDLCRNPHRSPAGNLPCDLPSNARQQPSQMEAQSTTAEVLKSKDTDLSSSDGEDATLQTGPDNVIDQTDDVLRRYS